MASDGNQAHRGFDPYTHVNLDRINRSAPVSLLKWTYVEKNALAQMNYLEMLAFGKGAAVSHRQKQSRALPAHFPRPMARAVVWPLVLLPSR